MVDIGYAIWFTDTVSQFPVLDCFLQSRFAVVWVLWPVWHSIHSVLMMEILLTRTKNKAICNARVNFYSNTTNLQKHLISRIRRHDFHNEWMADGATHCFVYYTHTKAQTAHAVFSDFPSHIWWYEHTNIISSYSESHFISIVPFNLIKLPSYHIHSSCKFLTANRQTKSLV